MCSECVFVASVIQHATRKRHIILSSVACPPLRYLSTSSHKLQDFRNNVIEYKNVCPDFLCDFVRNIFHSKKNSARYSHKCAEVLM